MKPPPHLMDGTTTRAAPVALEGVAAPSVMTVVRVDGKRHSCGRARQLGQFAVRRVGVSGSSVTLLSRDERTVRACDSTRDGSRCGQAFAPLRPDRRVDARLSLTCYQPDGSPIAFAWIQPSRDAAYVVVEQRDYVEVYAVAAVAPVRVTTAQVDLSTSSARLDVTEHAADGRRIRAYTLEPQVAG